MSQASNHYPERLPGADEWPGPHDEVFYADPDWDCPDRWYADPEAAAEYIRWSESLPMAEWPGNEEPPW